MAESEDMLQELGVRVLAMRDLLTRLLAYEAKRHPDQNLWFEEISNTTAAKSREVTKSDSLDDKTSITFQENIQSEMDNMIGAARRILENGL